MTKNMASDYGKQSFIARNPDREKIWKKFFDNMIRFILVCRVTSFYPNLKYEGKLVLSRFINLTFYQWSVP